MIVVITGPVRSGKSARAAQVARELGLPVTFVATARLDPSDAEMAARVARHRADRGVVPTIELWDRDARELPEIVMSAPAASTLLVDSLGTWIAGHLLEIEDVVERDAVAATELLAEWIAPLAHAVTQATCNLVFVSEETGWGLVPPSPLGRIFRDALGRLTARIARSAERVELVVAGFALDLRAYGVCVDG